MSDRRDGGLFYELGRLSARTGDGRDRQVDASGSPDPSSGSGTDPVERTRNLVVGVVVGAFALGAFLDLVAVTPGAIAAIAVFVLAVAAVADSVVIVQAYERRALTVFGAMERLLAPGIHFVPPFVSETHEFDMRTETLDVPSQEAITRDNSPVTADAVLYVRVVDAERAFLGVDDYRRATSLLAQTTLRAVLGDMELDETLSRREAINDRIHEELDEPTDAWGVRVEAVEVREVKPSQTVTAAMEQQTAAERRRRAMILEAQGERRSAIETAEGDKQSNIIRAQGEKRAQILEAQGDAVATVLRARAAQSMGERAVLEKGLATLEAVGEGESTTFVLPQELTSLVGRYGRHLAGSDVRGDAPVLDARSFDAETRDLLGLDAIDDLATDGVDIEVE